MPFLRIQTFAKSISVECEQMNWRASFPWPTLSGQKPGDDVKNQLARGWNWIEWGKGTNDFFNKCIHRTIAHSLVSGAMSRSYIGLVKESTPQVLRVLRVRWNYAAIQSLCPTWSGFGLFVTMIECWKVCCFGLPMYFWHVLTFGSFQLMSCKRGSAAIKTMMSWWLINHTNVYKCAVLGSSSKFLARMLKLSTSEPISLKPAFDSRHRIWGESWQEKVARLQKAKLQVKMSPQQGAFHICNAVSQCCAVT